MGPSTLSRTKQPLLHLRRELARRMLARHALQRGLPKLPCPRVAKSPTATVVARAQTGAAYSATVLRPLSRARHRMAFGLPRKSTVRERLPLLPLPIRRATSRQSSSKAFTKHSAKSRPCLLPTPATTVQPHPSTARPSHCQSPI